MDRLGRQRLGCVVHANTYVFAGGPTTIHPNTLPCTWRYGLAAVARPRPINGRRGLARVWTSGAGSNDASLRESCVS
jgi:hypothetical protein